MANPYESVPDEALEAMIRDARAALHERRHHGVSVRTLPGFLDPESQDFMGLGMSIHELVASGQIERHIRSFGRQLRPEQNRRLDYVIRLSVALTEILKVTHFSTSLARAAIADVIEGDWVLVKSWVEHFSFGPEQGELRGRMAPVFAEFRGILQEALDTTPKSEEPERTPN